jgi:steroid delta-isomerase-like uncharacterized protein
MSEQNKAVARGVLEAWTRGDLDALDDLVAPDSVDHDAYNPFHDEGLAGLKKLIQMYRSAFPDSSFTIEDQVAEGDLVATRWTAHGTQEGELMGNPPTGKTVAVSGMSIDRLQDGKVVESWGNWDTLGMFQQLGLAAQAEPAQA